MNSNTQVIAHCFLLSLSFGNQFFSPVVSTKLTGVGFYKLGVSIVLTTLIFCLGLDFFMTPAITRVEYFCYTFLLFSNFLTYIFHKDQKNWLMWSFYALQILVFSILVFHVFNFDSHWITFFYLSMCLLGISNFAMILGHYYLVVPKLSEEPLIYCLFIFWVIIFLKIILSISNILSFGMPYLEENTILGDGYVYNWLFVIMRYLWGFIAPLILSFFTFKLCRIRSIQSATGVLYIVEFFVIVGELISIYMMVRHGLAI